MKALRDSQTQLNDVLSTVLPIFSICHSHFSGNIRKEEFTINRKVDGWSTKLY